MGMFDSYTSEQASDIDPRDVEAMEARQREITDDYERAESDAQDEAQ